MIWLHALLIPFSLMVVVLTKYPIQTAERRKDLFRLMVLVHHGREGMAAELAPAVVIGT